MEIMAPRMDAGAISDRYRGAVNEAIPTAMPRMKRIDVRMPAVVAMEQASDPKANSTAAISIVFFRPRRLVKIPLIKAPKVAPHNSALTINSLCSGVRLKSFEIKGSAPATPLFLLKGVVFEGNTVFSDPDLQKVASGFLNQQVSLADLEKFF